MPRPGCRLAVLDGDKMRIEGMVADIETGKTIHASLYRDSVYTDELGERLASKMIAMEL